MIVTFFKEIHITNTNCFSVTKLYCSERDMKWNSIRIYVGHALSLVHQIREVLSALH